MALFLITGASGSGKTSLAQALQDKGIWNKCVTHTTRCIREGETHGTSYYFITEDVFVQMLANGEFAESVVYNNNKYGTSKKEIQFRIEEGEHVYIIVEYDGYKRLKEVYPDAIGIFLYTSIEDCMRNMLDRGDSLESANERMMTYHEEIRHRSEYDYVIQNVRNKFHETVAIIKGIVAQQ